MQNTRFTSQKNQSISLIIGTTLLLILTYTYIIAAGFYLSGFSLLPYVLPLGIVLSIITDLIIFDKKKLSLSLFYTGLIIISSVLLSSLIYDWSFDGNFYHQEIITALCKGWNPYIDTMGFDNLDLWDYHYAKALEIISSSIVSLTHNIESGKSVNLMLMCSSLFVSYHIIAYDIKNISKNQIGILIFLIVLNPVFICQAFTYYIDYAVYFYILNTILASTSLCKNSDYTINYIIIDCSIILAIGTKFNVFFLEGIVIACILLAFFIYNYKQFIASYLVNILIVGLLGAFIVSYHPYVTNLILQGNPLYPLLGDNKIDIMTANTPIEVMGENRIMSFIYSVFTVALPVYDSRMGGFGPLFGIILVICIALIIISSFKNKKFTILNYIFFCILCSNFIFEQSWWARYNPQLWLLVPCAFYQILTINFKYSNILRICFILIVTLNVLICCSYTFLRTSRFINERFSLFKALQGEKVYLHNSKIQWVRQLEENGIEVTQNEQNNETSMDTVFVYGSSLQKHPFPYLLVSKSKYLELDSIKQNSMFHKLEKKIKFN